MKTLGGIILIAAVFLASPHLLHAQSQLSGRPVLAGGVESAAPADSIVQATAEAQGLELVSPTDLPPVGTFWIVTPSGTYPFPCPMSDANAPTWQIADGVYLVDQTGGQIMIPHRHGVSLANVSVADALAAQADAVVNLINRVQDDQFTSELASSLGLSMEMDSPSGYSPMFSVIDTNGLWLDSPNVSNGWSYLNLHNGTNFVYAIWSSTNLATPFSNWEVETELFPTGDQTNVMPFAVQNIGRTPLFLRAEDWTGIDSDNDGIPDWWAWQYWGGINVTDTNLDYSGNGSTFAQDYSNNVAPTVFSFTGLEVANNYVSSMSAPVQLDVAGSPYYIAVSVDDTNYAADANRQAYAGTNLTVNLGIAEGWHDVWVGLRGHGDDTNAAVWQWRRLKLDFTPPALVLTSPTNGTVNVPVIQLTGFSSEALASISYDLTNALGWMTNQQVLVEGQFYDTNTMEFTTNYFQGYDVPLTNGVNTITLHATDLAGNVTILTTNINYVPTTNPPAVNLVWPQDGMQISGSSLTFQGQVDDPTTTATVTVVDANGNTNSINGLTGRDGNFWVENIPLNAGTNLVTVTVANAAGVSTMALSLMQSSVSLTINPVQAGETNVTGSIDTDGYTVWVNGNEATDNGDGTWTAQITPIGIGGGLVIAEAVPDGNSFSSSRRMAGRFQSMQESDQDPDIYAEAMVQPPQGVFVSQYYSHAETNSGIWWNFTNDVEWVPESWHNNLDWRDGGGGHEEIFESEFYRQWLIGTDEIGWPVNNWPQALPDGGGSDGTNLLLAVGTPPLAMEHCDINVNLDSVTTARRTADTEVKLATGGPLGSRQLNLWCISASATDQNTGLPIAFTNIAIGTFGHLDTNGNLWVMLPDNDPDNITPNVPGNPNYTFMINTQEYEATINDNGTRLDDTWVNTTNCVGQQVAFTLGWSPPLPYHSKAFSRIIAYWSLPGTFVNTNADPNCDLYYTKDPQQLINNALAGNDDDKTTAAIQTSCWYVDGIKAGAAKLNLNLWFKDGQSAKGQVTGLFSVFRPTVRDNNPDNPVSPSSDHPYPHGTPTPQIIGNFLSLGVNRDKDMSFRHLIDSGTFSGGAGYVQLVGFDDPNTDPDNVKTHVPLLSGHLDINLHPVNNLDTLPGLGEMPRGTNDIPIFDASNTNASWTQPFYDAPRVFLADNDTETIQHLHFHNYLMFQPQASGYGPSIFVPLRKINWKIWSSGQQGQSQPDSSSAAIDSDSNSTTFPHWNGTVNLNANQPDN